MQRLTSTAVALATAVVLPISMWSAAVAAPATVDRTAADRGTGDAGYALKAAGYGTRVDRRPGARRLGPDRVHVDRLRDPRRPRAREPRGRGHPAGRRHGVRREDPPVDRASSGGAVHSWSRNTTADVVLAQSGFGKLEISAIRSLSHAWHDGTGFHAETATSIGHLTFVPPTGDPQELDLPTPGQPVDIPGFAHIVFGGATRTENDHAGVASANALRVKLIPSDTSVTVAHTTARVLDGVRHGTFHGSSAATKVSAADSNLTSGRTPLSLMPCQGTDGKLRSKKIAHADLGGQVVVEGLTSAERGEQFPGRSVAMERGSIAGLDLGDGQLVVDAVVGQANVTRKAGRVTANTKGTTLGTITANGEPQSFPDTDVLEIPGVAKLERNIVHRTKYGISVVALRITLLDGTGAVIDLGQARAFIRHR